MSAELPDYLDLTVSQARQQFRELKRRSPVSSAAKPSSSPSRPCSAWPYAFQINHRAGLGLRDPQRERAGLCLRPQRPRVKMAAG